MRCGRREVAPQLHDVSKRWRRLLLVVATATTTVALSGCSSSLTEQAKRIGMLPPASDRAPYMERLWQGAWIASAVVGIIVWGLMFYAAIKWRRRRGDPEIPRQTKYHLPLELLYTLIPILIIGVLFFYTVRTQNHVLAKDAKPQHTIHVLGEKWSWSFSYMEADNPKVGAVVHTVGTIQDYPDLYLPLGESVRFDVTSADVDHSFWIPDFYFKIDAIPGHPNSFDLTPSKLGTYDGKCAELCGTYHSKMLFTVHVVTPEQYYQHLQQLKAQGMTGEYLGPKMPQAIASESAVQKEPGK